jgi:hypothetical protein
MFFNVPIYLFKLAPSSGHKVRGLRSYFGHNKILTVGPNRFVGGA